MLCKHTFSSNPVKSIISKRFINFEKIQLLLIFSNPNIDNVSVTVALNGRAYEHCYRYNSNKIFIYYFEKYVYLYEKQTEGKLEEGVIFRAYSNELKWIVQECMYLVRKKAKLDYYEKLKIKEKKEK